MEDSNNDKKHFNGLVGFFDDIFTRKKNSVERTYNIGQEQSSWENYDNPAFNFAPYNPDDLYQRLGKYTTYEEMLKDEQVEICMSMKKDLIIGNGWDILPEDEEDIEIAKELKVMLQEDPEISFDESLEEIAGTAFEFGFSVSEKVFKMKEQKVTLKYIKTRHPASWELPTDKYGNITDYMNDVNGVLVPIDSNSIIHYVNRRKFQNPYGTSDLRSAYAAWIAKRHVIRFYSVFMERSAGPTPVAKIDSKAPQNAKEKIYDMIRRLQSKTAMVIPKEFEVEFLEAKSNGEAYDKALNIFNMMIGRALLTTDLMGISGGETKGGSFSLGQKHYDLFLMHINKRRGILERLINLTVIKPLVLWNYGQMDRYPKFKFKPLTEENVVEFAKLWTEFVKTRSFKPNIEQVNHFNELIGFPKTNELEETEQPIAPNPNDPNNPVNEPNSDPNINQGNNPNDEDKKAFTVFKKPIGEYDKKTNYASLKNQMDGARDALMNQVNPIIKMIWDDLADQVEKKKILEKKKVEAIDSLKVKHLKKLQVALKSALRDFWKLSAVTANNELFKQNFSENLLTDEVIKLLEQETFNYVGDFEYRTNQGARLALTNALKDGAPLSSVVSIFTENGVKDSNVSVERFARTKFTEVMNRARKETFDNSGVVAAYQYSAILDDRTTDICSALHGQIFKAGTEPTAPLHFNCRSTIIPITRFEEWEPNKVSVIKDKENQIVVKTNQGTGKVGKGFSYQ